MPRGTVKETKPGFVKVYFNEYEYTTDWIQVVSPLAGSQKSVFNIPLDAQVFVLQEYDQYGEIKEQVCLGATYNNVDTLPFGDDKNKEGFRLTDDKTMILFDDDTNAVRYTELKNVLDDMNLKYNAFLDLYGTHTHICAAPSSPSATPLPLATTPLDLSFTGETSTIKSEKIKLK
jgi:phage baseplate assembly protein gpV